MAPIGRSLPSEKSPFSKDESCTKMIGEDEIKEEPPDEGYHHGFVQVVRVKVEEKELPSFAPMNEDEGCIIKQEDVDHGLIMSDEDKLTVEILHETCANGGVDDSVKICDRNLLDSTEDTSNSLLCKVCGKQFFRSFYFNMHVKTHEGPAPVNSPVLDKPFKCHECGKSFASNQHLAGHSRIHIAGKYFECPVCRRKFIELSNLTMHLLKTHPDEKPYKCSECDKHFQQSSALKKHLRTHDSVTSQEELERIDMMFFVDDKSEKDIEEPMRKKIKLEPEEDKILSVKEKLLPQKDEVSPKDKSISPKTKSPPSKDRHPVLKAKSPGKGSPVLSFSKVSTSADISDSIKDEPAPESAADRVEELAFSSPSKVCAMSPSEDVPSPKYSPLNLVVGRTETGKSLDLTTKQRVVRSLEASLPSTNLHSSVEPPSCNDAVLSLERNVRACSNKESLIKESPSFNQLKESLPLRNGVPLDQVHSPQIKVMKFAKLGHDNEPLSVKGQSLLSSPLKAISGVHLNNLDATEVMEETENSNLPQMCNSERNQKGRSPALLSLSRNKSDLFVGWEKNKPETREPYPSVVKPDGDYEIKYKCHRCEIFLESEEKLHNHLMDHTGVKLCECRFCGKDFTTLTSLKRHLYFHVVGAIPQDCTRCGGSFQCFRDLKEHCLNKKCETVSNSLFKCFRCRKQTSSLKKLKVHLLSQCNDEPIKYYLPKKNGSSVDVCTAANEILGNADAEPKTPVEETESVKSSSRNEWVTQKFEKADSLSQSDIKELNCDPTDAEAVMVLSELEAEKGKECWTLHCERCGQKFENPTKAKVHAQVGCAFYSESAESRTEEENGPMKMKVVFEEDGNYHCYLTCSECDMKFLGVEKMLLHIQEHIHEENRLTCPVLKCGKLFKDPKEFKLHLKAHTGHKPFKCSDCGKRFFLRENYENHAQRHGILKNWSSLNTILGEKIGKSFSSARSPITIESSIVNLEVSESSIDKMSKSNPQQPTRVPENVKEEKKPHKKDQVVSRSKLPLNRPHSFNKPSVPFNRPTPLSRHVPFNKTSASVNRTAPTVKQTPSSVNKTPPSVIKSSPSLNRPSPSLNRPLPLVNKSSPPANRTPPVNRSPPPSLKTSPSVNGSPPPTIKTSSPVNGTLHPVIRQLDLPQPIVGRLPTIGSPILNRLGHSSGGSLSVTPQGIFAVAPPRTYPGSSSLANGPKATFLVASTKLNLGQKETHGRVHPPSYYHLSDQARANIQASNAELRKYPRSGRCEVCKKICSRLDKHMMVHLNQKPHLCPICPQAFRQSEHLRRHIRARHEGNHRQFQCPRCSKRLTRKDKLKEHMKNCRSLFGEGLTEDSHTLGDSLFELMPGPSHFSEPPLQGHTTE